MRVRARITAPAPAAVLDAGACTVRGKAWSGTGPVTRVEVSLTGEGDWFQAQLQKPAGPYSWQDWSFEWDATAVGRHTLRARATDAAGTSSRRCRRGTGSATATTPSRSSTSTCADDAARRCRSVI